MTTKKPGHLTLIGYVEAWSLRHTFCIIKTADLPRWQNNRDMLHPLHLEVLAQGNEFSLINSLEAAIKSYRNDQRVKKMMGGR